MAKYSPYREKSQLLYLHENSTACVVVYIEVQAVTKAKNVNADIDDNMARAEIDANEAKAEIEEMLDHCKVNEKNTKTATTHEDEYDLSKVNDTNELNQKYPVIGPKTGPKIELTQMALPSLQTH